MTLSIFPTASLLDAEEQTEGSLDPLGTYNISELLASRIGSPGVRERQRNLRFLTLCCVGWEVLASMDPEIKPGDQGVTYEQAFEWLTVEALVAGERKDGGAGFGSLPGINKARACIRAQLHLNADRYLRTASVFGFFGVYRTLAEYIGLVVPRSDESPLLGPEGSRLLTVWRYEQGLEGFGRGLRGVGQKEYAALVDTLQATWQAGQVVADKRSFSVIQQYLQPLCPGGPQEQADLVRLITEPGRREEDDHRRQVLKVLDRKEARALMMANESNAEQKFHRLLRSFASDSLVGVLDAVSAYESFIRPLHDTFDDLLFSLSSQSRLISSSDLADGLSDLGPRAKVMPKLFLTAQIALGKIGDLGARFEREFDIFSKPMTGKELLGALLFHHETVQKKKPPVGKAPWIEHPDHRVAVRPMYRRQNGAGADEGYVYFYRARPLFDLVRGARGQYGED